MSRSLGQRPGDPHLGLGRRRRCQPLLPDSPCKTFAGAICKTAAAGEINALDPGGFGAVTITKSITIDATAGLGGVLAAGSNGVIVNAAATDVVILRNLDLNGAGTGINGVRILQARDVYVENGKIFGFTGRGISDERTAGRLFVADTVISNNTQTGVVAVAATASTLVVNLNHVRLERNGNAGFALTQGAKATIVDTTAAGNTNYGFYADGAGSEVNLESSRATGNGIGISSLLSGVFRISNTTVTGNGTGLQRHSRRQHPLVWKQPDRRERLGQRSGHGVSGPAVVATPVRPDEHPTCGSSGLPSQRALRPDSPAPNRRPCGRGLCYDDETWLRRE